MSEEELISKARSGDKEATETLLNAYLPLVKSVAARFFLNGGEADDLVQEGLVGLFSAINTYKAGSVAFGAYAHSCIRNAALDAVKKSKAKKYSALNDSVPIVEIVGEPVAGGPEYELIKKENRKEFLQKILKVLSGLEFKVIVMYLDGAGVQEISAALAKPQKSVSNALSRAKTKLEKLYTQ